EPFVCPAHLSSHPPNGIPDRSLGGVAIRVVDGEPNFACPAPVPVTGLVASISADNRVDLASDDAGAESYNVYRSRLSGGPFEPIGSTDEPSFTYPDVS